jgi:sulfide:quinone oxidoreductase
MTPAQPSRPDSPAHERPFRVVIAGGGVAGAEALLALHALAGHRTRLTLVSARDELVLPALAVAEPFALGHAERIPLRLLAERTGAELVIGTVIGVDDKLHRVYLQEGLELEYDALLITVGACPVARVEHATTWWPGGDEEILGGLLRDLEGGYTKRVAFVIPPGAVWPLPLYELALLTAREVQSMGIDDAELTVITPEAMPLSPFGPDAAAAVRDELLAAGVRLETASVARIEREPQLAIVLQPSRRRLAVERVIALPAVKGPAIPGTSHDDAGFILVARDGRMHGSQSVWAAGDATTSPVKYGGISTRQADAAAHAIAGRAGVQTPAIPRRPLGGVLLTGGAARSLGVGNGLPSAKVSGTYLTPFLQERAGEHPDAPAHDELSALESTEEFVRGVGREIRHYERDHPVGGRRARS